MIIRLRPHHILCSVGFEGKGYGDAFTANMGNIVNGQLRQSGGGAVRILITGSADAICAPCPKRMGLGCAQQERIETIDAAHADALDLAPGTILTWQDCLDRIALRIEPDDLDRLCAGCSWLEEGMCKRAVGDLLRKNEKAAPAGTA